MNVFTDGSVLATAGSRAGFRIPSLWIKKSNNPGKVISVFLYGVFVDGHNSGSGEVSSSVTKAAFTLSSFSTNVISAKTTPLPTHTRSVVLMFVIEKKKKMQKVL